MGGSVPKHPEPIVLTDTSLESSVSRTRPTTTRENRRRWKGLISRDTQSVFGQTHQPTWSHLFSCAVHSRIQTTLDIYTQGDGDETRAAQGAFLKELGMASEMIQ